MRGNPRCFSLFSLTYITIAFCIVTTEVVEASAWVKVLESILFKLKQRQIFESQSLYEGSLRISQLHSKLQNLYDEGIFTDNNPLTPLSKSYIIFEAGPRMSKWTRQKSLFQDDYQSDTSESLTIESIMSPSTVYKEDSVSALLVKGRRYKSGFTCASLTFTGNRVEGNKTSGAGVVFGLDKNKAAFWIVLVRRSGLVSLEKRTFRGRIEEKYEAKSPMPIVNWRDYTLGVQYFNNTVSVFVNRNNALEVHPGESIEGATGVAFTGDKVFFSNVSSGKVADLPFSAFSQSCFDS